MIALDEAHLLNFAVAAEMAEPGHRARLPRPHDRASRAPPACQIVYLEVRPSNVAARHLYRTMGFQQIAIRPDYYPRRLAGARTRSSSAWRCDGRRVAEGARALRGGEACTPGRLRTCRRAGRGDDATRRARRKRNRAALIACHGLAMSVASTDDAPPARPAACASSASRPCSAWAASPAPWLFVGEGPGADEDEQGEPFVGQAGKLLDSMLAAIGIAARARGLHRQRREVPPAGQPHARRREEAAACAPFLDRADRAHRAEAHRGASARPRRSRLLNTEASLASLRGRVHRYRGTPLVVTYHPAYLLRTPPGQGEGVGGPAVRAPHAAPRYRGTLKSPRDRPHYSRCARSRCHQGEQRCASFCGLCRSRRSPLSGCGYNDFQTKDEAGEGRLGRGAEPVQAPRRPHPQPRADGEGYAAQEKDVLLRRHERAAPRWARCRPRREMVNNPQAMAQLQRRAGRASSALSRAGGGGELSAVKSDALFTVTCRRSSRARRTASPPRATASSRRCRTTTSSRAVPDQPHGDDLRLQGEGVASRSRTRRRSRAAEGRFQRPSPRSRRPGAAIARARAPQVAAAQTLLAGRLPRRRPCSAAGGCARRGRPRSPKLASRASPTRRARSLAPERDGARRRSCAAFEQATRLAGRGAASCRRSAPRRSRSSPGASPTSGSSAARAWTTACSSRSPKQERKMRIHTGRGVQGTLTDALSKRIVAEHRRAALPQRRLRRRHRRGRGRDHEGDRGRERCAAGEGGRHPRKVDTVSSYCDFLMARALPRARSSRMVLRTDGGPFFGGGRHLGGSPASLAWLLFGSIALRASIARDPRLRLRALRRQRTAAGAARRGGWGGGFPAAVVLGWRRWWRRRLQRRRRRLRRRRRFGAGDWDARAVLAAHRR